MTRHIRRFLFPLIAALLLSPSANATRLILEIGSGDINLVAARYGLTVISRVQAKDAAVYLVSAPDPTPPSLLQAIANDPAVKDVDTAGESHTPATPAASAVDPTALLASLQDKTTMP